MRELLSQTETTEVRIRSLKVGIDTGILRFMETAPTYRITSRSGNVIANDLPRSAPAVQLHEGTLSKGNRLPKDLSPGESTIVSYPLVEGRLICRVTRTDGTVPIVNMGVSFDFVEPDPVQSKSKPKVAAMLEKQVGEAIEGTKARRGRGRKASP